MLFVTINTDAQSSFKMYPNDTIIEMVPLNAYSELKIIQRNLTSDTLILAIKVVKNTIPSDWQGSLCIYGVCFGYIPTVGSTAQMDMIIDSTDAYVRLSVNPLGNTDGGELRVLVYDINNTSDSAYCTYILNSNITTSEFIESQISIFPNPVKDLLYLQNYLGFYTIHDANGKLLVKGNSYDRSTTIDVNKLLLGVYYIKTNNKTTKFIKITK